MCINGPNPQRLYLSKQATYHPELQKTNCPVQVGDVIKLYSPASTLKPLEAVGQSPWGWLLFSFWESRDAVITAKRTAQRSVYLQSSSWQTEDYLIPVYFENVWRIKKRYIIVCPPKRWNNLQKRPFHNKLHINWCTYSESSLRLSGTSRTSMTPHSFLCSVTSPRQPKVSPR